MRQRLHTAQPLPVKDGAVALNGWVAVNLDGSVSVVVPRIMQAPVDKIFANVALMRDMLPFHPDERGNTGAGAKWVLAKVARELGLMITGGSTSVKDAWQPMREAGAAARAMLVAAAAAK